MKSLHVELADALVWKLLWKALGRLLYQDLARPAPAAAGPFATILYNSLCEDLVEILKCFFFRRPLHDLVQVLVRRSWRGPGETLSVSLKWSGARPCEKICACWNPLAVRALRSWRSSASSGMLIDLIGSSCLKIFWAPLCRCCCSCGSVQPHLLLLHSYCCLYLVQRLPTHHTVWGLLPDCFTHIICLFAYAYHVVGWEGLGWGGVGLGWGRACSC